MPVDYKNTWNHWARLDHPNVDGVVERAHPVAHGRSDRIVTTIAVPDAHDDPTPGTRRRGHASSTSTRRKCVEHEMHGS